MSISKHLKQKPKTIKVQGAVRDGLWNSVNVKREKYKITWPELLEAMFLAYLDEETENVEAAFKACLQVTKRSKKRQ